MRCLTASAAFVLVFVGIQAQPSETRAPPAQELSEQDGYTSPAAADKSKFCGEALGHTAALAQTSLRAARRCFEKCSGNISIYVCIAVVCLIFLLAKCRKYWFRNFSKPTDSLHSKSGHSVQVTAVQRRSIHSVEVKDAFTLVHPPEQLAVTSDDVVSNLMRRFPERSRRQVEDTLRSVHGHAGQAAKLLSKALPNEQLAIRSTDVVENLMRRFPERSRQEVEDVLRSSHGHAGMAAAWFKGQLPPVTPRYDYDPPQKNAPSKGVKVPVTPRVIEKGRQELEDVLRTRSQRRGVLVN